MPKPPPNIRALRVIAPCTENWETMTGDTRQRFCAECGKQVHNLSALTPSEARSVLVQNPVGVCTRFERDEAGEILFQPEASSQRLFTRRALSVAAGVMGTALSLSSPTLAQQPQTETRPRQTAKPAQSNKKDAEPVAVLKATVIDPTQAVIVGATVILRFDKTGEMRKVTTDEVGSVTIRGLQPGTYSLRIEARGFVSSETSNLEFAPGAEKIIEAMLNVGDAGADKINVGDANAGTVKVKNAPEMGLTAEVPCPPPRKKSGFWYQMGRAMAYPFRVVARRFT
ncbi:MAG: carboxypeptidase-like regulatory domain-containing protein [Blastocatellia bacterium]|nr:carboxypeptidase-like regulatory domain-containing protein [Blastocatellia bacterium]